MRRRLPSLLALAVVAALALPAAASAHAVLEATTPVRGAVVATQPTQVELRFDEPVEGSLGAVRVFDARGDRVDRGDAFHPGSDGGRLAVRLEDGLARGTYTATYRVVSADGHVVSGGFPFSIGRASTAGQTVEELLGSSGAGPVTSTAFSVARALQYAALAIAAGTLLFVLAIWPGAPPPALLRRARHLLLWSAVVGAISALAGVALEGAQAAGVNGWHALRPEIIGDVVDTRFGRFWTGAAIAWALVAAAAARASEERRGSELALAGGPLVFLLLVPALSGHAVTQSPVAVLLPANVVHVAAMAAWIGGLVCLLVAVPAVTRSLAPADRAAALVGPLLRFSAVALWAVVALAVSGLAQAYVEIRHLDLVTATAFGRAVAIKVVVLLALVALGTLNRRRTIPRLRAAAVARRPPGEAGLALRRTLRAEVALLAVALAATGALAGYAPAVEHVGGPYDATTRIGPQELQVTVSPARVGSNEVHLYLSDPASGAPLDTARAVTVRASLPDKGIGPISDDARKAGPGHYVLGGLALGVPGTWRIDVVVRVSAFDEYEKALEVRVS